VGSNPIFSTSSYEALSEVGQNYPQNLRGIGDIL